MPGPFPWSPAGPAGLPIGSGTSPVSSGVPIPSPPVTPGAPVNAAYVVIGTVPPTLPDARMLAAGVGISISDGGPRGPATIFATEPAASGGFGFSIGGLPGASEICGFGIIPASRVFTNGDATTYVTAEYPASGSPVFNIQTWIAGVRATVGTITFAGAVGTVAWSSSPYTLPADTIIELHAPASQDLSLAWITGWVNGAAA